MKTPDATTRCKDYPLNLQIEIMTNALTMLAEFDKYFQSMNRVPPEVRTSVPTAEWVALRDAVQAALAAPAQRSGTAPMFWVRLCSDGLYEGPIHHRRIEDVRKQSGAWSPLYLHAPQAPQQAEPVTLPEHQRSAPPVIYLHDGDDEHTEPFPAGMDDGVTWSSDNATGTACPCFKPSP